MQKCVKLFIWNKKALLLQYFIIFHNTDKCINCLYYITSEVLQIKKLKEIQFI